MSKKHSLLFGAHMSIAGGIYQSIERGESIGCTAIQIFTKSNRQWHAKPLSSQDITAFKETAQKSSIRAIIVHATYLINIGSSNKDVEKKSVESLIMELNRCAELGINYLVLHPGSHADTDRETCLERISDNLNKVFKQASCPTYILLETMAGQGKTVCDRFEDIAQLIKNSHFKKQLGVCVDTCHIFAAGHDFRTKQTYDSLWKNFDKIIGIEKIHAMHINDSQQGLDSHVDRHATIGKGKIGLEGFKLLFNDPHFFDVPKILETPKDNLGDDKKNMETIYSLLTTATKKRLGVKG